MIEPLGFEAASLRHKAEVIDKLEKHGAHSAFKLVHDTFHHHLAGESEIFADYTGMVHISGVADHSLSIASMRDEHRILVDKLDQLGNLQQLLEFQRAGYSGPVSTEAFSPEVHAFSDPVAMLRESHDFIMSATAQAEVAC